MTDQLKHYDQIIVGAGIAGVAAAVQLQRAGHRNWLLLDKGRSVGGRLATRRIDQSRFDHGAQFFTVRSEEFGKVVADLVDRGVVREWCRGFRDGRGNILRDGHPRYAVNGGMNQLAKHLAAGLPEASIRLQERISRIDLVGEQWRLTTDSNEYWTAQDLVLTMPLPQAADLLATIDSATGVDTLITELKGIRYNPCIAIMGVFNARDLPSLDVPVQNPSGPISFVSDNGLKGVSPVPGALTIHLSGDASRKFWDASDHEVLDAFLPELGLLLGISPPPRPNPFQIHRWRFATPQTVFEKPFAEWAPVSVPSGAHRARILVAGEAFQGPKVEGAYLSGLAAGRYIGFP